MLNRLSHQKSHAGPKPKYTSLLPGFLKKNHRKTRNGQYRVAELKLLMKIQQYKITQALLYVEL